MSLEEGGGIRRDRLKPANSGPNSPLPLGYRWDHQQACDFISLSFLKPKWREQCNPPELLGRLHETKGRDSMHTEDLAFPGT